MANILVTWLEPEEKAGSAELVNRSKILQNSDLSIGMTVRVNVRTKVYKAIILHIHCEYCCIQY